MQNAFNFKSIFIINKLVYFRKKKMAPSKVITLGGEIIHVNKVLLNLYHLEATDLLLMLIHDYKQSHLKEYHSKLNQ